MSTFFWQRFNTLQKLYPDQLLRANSDAWKELAGMICQEINLHGWSEWWMASLMASLFQGSDSGLQSDRNDSPAPAQYDPRNVVVHNSVEEFQTLLYQFIPLGVITFLWDTWGSCGGEDSFYQPNKRVRIGAFISKHCIDQEDGNYFNFEAAVIGFIRKDRLELYTFPENWTEIIRQVRKDLDQMTAAEKLEKRLPAELRQFVELLGYDAVASALQSIERTE